MKKASTNKFRIIVACVGVALILAAAALLIYSYVSTKSAKQNAEKIVSQLYSLMPDVKDGVPDERLNPTMPMLQIDGEDFVGVLEVPQFGTVLPVYAKWDSSRVTKYPCRYLGSVYGSTLIIGGSDNKGQLDFVKTISNQDVVYITDTTGLRCKYTVYDINRTKDVSTENLTKNDARLVLFARNTYSFDYTVIYCK